jgi:NAD(P)-dependent dehydrogenase (short-subunit alcohol dehydrogenase family)
VTGGPLDGRGAVVTGAGRGIGAAIARSLAGAGAQVLLAARTASEVEETAAAIRAGGAKAWGVACDVTDETAVKRLAEAAQYHLGAADILVNNAGAAASASLRKITLQEWNRLFLVNATAAFLCTRELLPAMVERGWGRVVNVASLAGLEGARYVAHYSASKHALVGFTRSVAREVEGTGVTVNAVCPGYVDTAMTDRTVALVESRVGLPHDQALAAVLATTGQDRLIKPDEVAAAALALCLGDASHVNGQALVLGAGARAS